MNSWNCARAHRTHENPREPTWRCPREALLNGGDALVPRLLRAFGALRLRPSGSLHVEDGEMGDLKLSIAPGAWPQLCLEQF